MLTSRRHRIPCANRSSTARPAATADARRAPRARPIALVVDSDPDLRLILTLMLSPIGYDVVVTGNLDEARALAADWPPTLVVADLRLDMHDDRIAPAELRQIPTLAWIPMVVSSSWAYPGDAEIARALGADLFTTTPMDFGAVRRFATDLLRRTA